MNEVSNSDSPMTMTLNFFCWPLPVVPLKAPIMAKHDDDDDDDESWPCMYVWSCMHVVRRP